MKSLSLVNQTFWKEICIGWTNKLIVDNLKHKYRIELLSEQEKYLVSLEVTMTWSKQTFTRNRVKKKQHRAKTIQRTKRSDMS